MPSIKTFDDLASFALHLAAREVAVRQQGEKAMAKALSVITEDAKAQLGHYQNAVGDFPAWAPLAQSTEDQKRREGAPADAPLLRHGGMYASFDFTVASPEEGAAGSTDPTMVYHEFGTSKMAPRPVWGPAMVRSMPKVQKLLAQAVVEGILGGEVVADGGYFRG